MCVTKPPLVGVLALLIGGCASLPKGRAYVSKVEVEGAEEVASEDVTEKLATRGTPRFLGLFPGVVYDYEVLDHSVLARDLERVERFYRARGFYRAVVRAGRVYYDGPKKVRVEIVVDEGNPVLLYGLHIDGLDGVEREVALFAREAAEDRLPVGEPFDEDDFAEAEKAIQRVLTDHGYAFARVERTAEVDLPKNRAHAGYGVVPGPKAVFGEITIKGLGPLSESVVRRTIDIRPGEPYSTEEIDSAQRALLDLGVFGSARVEPMLDHRAQSTRRVPLRVSLEASKLRGVRLGGGVELDAVRTDAHLLAGWEDRNFFGGLRRFRVELKPGLVFYPTRIPSLEKPTHYLPEARLRLELRQPGVLEARTNALLRGELNVFPVLLATDPDPDAPIIGYREIRGSIGLDRSFGKIYLNPSHNVQSIVPFSYAGMLDPDLGPVLVSYPELAGVLDLRDDQIDPREGFYASAAVQVAGVGGDARDLKLRLEARGYVPVGSDLSVALRSTAGLLFPDNYGDSLLPNAQGDLPPPGDRASWVKDSQLQVIRGFYSGGPTSNRGYALRGVGPHGAIPFFDPSLGPDELAAKCQPGSADYSPGICLLPLGGLTLWEASAELRFALKGPLSSVAFCDASDVSPSQADFRFERLHLSCGSGLRYDTPIGPLRLDVGYRIPGMQVLADDRRGEGDPGEIWGLPIAIHVGVGEAF